MKRLTDFINEELDAAIVKKITAQRVKEKKIALVAIKKGLMSVSDNNEDTLRSLAEAVYSGIGEYNSREGMIKALNSDKISGWKEIHNAIVKANGNKEVDTDVILDVIEKIVNGMNLNAAVTAIAKNSL